MAVYKQGMSYARNAGADLSAALHKIAKVDTDGDIVLCGDGQAALGTIIESAAENRPVSVMLDGIAKVLLGAGVAAGALVASDGAGLGATATTGEYAIGMALWAGDTGDIIPVRLLPGAGRVA